MEKKTYELFGLHNIININPPQNATDLTIRKLFPVLGLNFLIPTHESEGRSFEGRDIQIHKGY